MISNSDVSKSISKKLALSVEFNSQMLFDSISQLSKNSVLLPQSKEITTTTFAVSDPILDEIYDSLLYTTTYCDDNPKKKTFFEFDNFMSPQFANFFIVYFFTDLDRAQPNRWNESRRALRYNSKNATIYDYELFKWVQLSIFIMPLVPSSDVDVLLFVRDLFDQYFLCRLIFVKCLIHYYIRG